jgi:gamma-glutamylcyclotransferase (GGCT)/AIG2-like uncharacterized protein YtfP
MTAEVDLFVYGTLKDEDTVFALTGCRFPRQEAQLLDFECIVPLTGYPYITPRPGARTLGLLLRGLNPAALTVLDQYEDEGRLYFRRKVTARVGNRCVPCETYVGNVAALVAETKNADQHRSQQGIKV